MLLAEPFNYTDLCRVFPELIAKSWLYTINNAYKEVGVWLFSRQTIGPIAGGEEPEKDISVYFLHAADNEVSFVKIRRHAFHLT